MPPVEILDNILEQLAPRQKQSLYSSEIRQTLSSCLSVCRKLRHLAAERLFQTIHVKSSVRSQRLDVLLTILDSPSQPWMSIRPFLRNFVFSIDSPDPIGTSPIVPYFMPNDFVPLFNTLAVANGTQCSRITHFEFRVLLPDIPIYSRSFEDAVLLFMKLPTLQSLEIHGPFFSRDFLLGTHIQDVGISGNGIDLSHESNDLYTEKLGAELVGSDDEEQTNYPNLRKFKTDLVWPRGLPDHALGFFFRELIILNVEINISHALIKAEALIRKSFSTLTTLIITYNYDGYEAELPTTWSINFAELRALETLEFNWRNSVSSVHQSTIVRGCRPLAGLHSLLDTIGAPMRSLSTIRWNFRYLGASLPPNTLLQWLQCDVRWRKLDQSLASARFPGLHFVSLDFNPVAVISQESQDTENEDSNRLILVSIDFDTVQSILSENRPKVFPNLTAWLGENFMVKAAGEIDNVVDN